MFGRIALVISVAGLSTFAEPNVLPSSSNGASASAPAAQRQADQAEQIRARCIDGRRYIAGRVLQVLPDGLVVDSGYSRLLSAPLNRSWVVRGTASVTRDPSAVEERKPDAICIGPVFLSNLPKRPPVKLYDYVVIHAYPAGEYVYSPVAGVQKTVRRFSASLDRAVQMTMARESK